MPGFAGSPSTIAVLKPSSSGFSVHFRSSCFTRFTGSGVDARCCPKTGELDSNNPPASAAAANPPRATRIDVVFMAQILPENGARLADISVWALELLHDVASSVYTFEHWNWEGAA